MSSRKVKDARNGTRSFGFRPSTLKVIVDLKPKYEIFTCPKCDRKFMTINALRNHLVNYHGISNVKIIVNPAIDPQEKPFLEKMKDMQDQFTKYTRMKFN
tara:strand:+ start:371 stop:670 length:300 start_codon:yes stop_codon:yes gene_type:complete